MPPAYEVLLLNTAIPQIQAAQSGDTYVVPRDIAFSAALTLSAGTANGVPYLNGSKVLTTGSALTFDGTNLSSTGGATLLGGPIGYGGGEVVLGPTTSGVTSAVLTQAAGAPILFFDHRGTSNTGVFAWRNGTDGANELMRLTSTGLGIGTSLPGAKLDVVGSGQFRGSSPSIIAEANNGTQATLRLTQNGVGNWLKYFRVSDNALVEQFGGTDLLALSSSGNLGLGVTPSAWGSGYKSLDIGSVASFFSDNNVTANVSANQYIDAGGRKYKTSDYATMYQQYIGQHQWYTAPSGTANSASVTSGASYTVVALGSSTLAQWQAFFNDSSNNPLTVTPTLGQVLTGNATGTLLGGGLVTQNISFTQAMTLDASGNLGVGTTTPVSALGFGQAASATGITFQSTSTTFNSGKAAVIKASIPGSGNGALIFETYEGGSGGGERARITSGGYFKASNTGSYKNATGSFHELRSNASDDTSVNIHNSAATNPYGAVVEFSGAAPNDATRYFLSCLDTGATRATIRSNGGLANYQSNNVDLSDARTKTDISPLGSYWNKIAGLEIVTYKYKDQTHNDLNIGVIAQQVEQVAPEFVDADGFGETPEDGVPLKTIYNKDLTFAAIKALQEAMARIEQLEAKVAALEAK